MKRVRVGRMHVLCVVGLAWVAGGANQANGGDYYVGGAGASDRNPGTASQPFATIQKAARVAVAGDFVNIRAGTYRETITPANSGTPDRPITFQPDGDAVVTVSGADPAEGGWTVYRGNIYQTTIALPVTGYQEQITGNAALLANQVFVGGKMMIEARWPNVANSDDLLNRADFRPVPQGAWTTGMATTLRDAGIPDIPSGWTGGTIWFIGWYQPQSSTITASSAGQIQFPASAEEKFHDSYYLTGRLGALDAEKEWFYDGTKLYLWAPGGGSPEQVMKPSGEHRSVQNAHRAERPRVKTLSRLGVPQRAKSVFLTTVTVSLLAADTSVAAVAAWTRWEHALTSATNYTNPYQQPTLTVTYTAPSGQTFECYGFWDGGQTFRVRFMFPAPGTWTWKTTCSDAGNTGLHEQSGAVNVVEYAGGNPLYRNGYLKVSRNRRYLAHWNGKPFLWIGDTPWSVFVTATQEEWERYLQNRRDNKFTVVQVHCGGCWDWVGKLKTDRYGNPPFAGSGDSLQWNPAYWRQVDRKVQAANDLGLLVYVCAVRQPGDGFPVDDSDQVSLFAQNLAARLMGNFVLYSPIADDLWTPQADAAGESLDRATPMQLISAHPRFFLEPAMTSHGKDYIDVVGLQTGEGWQHDPYKKEGPKPWSQPLAAQNAIEWPLALYRLTPVKPVINQEGPYDHLPYTNNPEHPMPLPPRKTGYWSFLSGAPGLTYGCFGIWNWGRPVRWMPSYDYETALKVESARHMKYMSEFFSAIAWWTLEPRHDLVLGQPDDWMQRMALAKSASGDLAVAYLPDNAEITVNMKAFPAPMQARWFNPTTGEYQAVWGTIPVTDRHTFARPSGWQDALLVLRKETDR